jgi:glyoxylase-like metal-dependent hydrolase (beta-lactamase superfamily II)
MKDSEETNNWIRASARGVPMDIGLRGGETLRLSSDWIVDILHTPGHSWGHVTVYDPHSKTAIIADAALWNSVLTKDGRPAFPPTYRYVETYIGTIERLQAMSIDTLLTSHYPVKRGSEVAEFLGESRSYVDRIDAALIEALKAAKNGQTLKELIAGLKSTVGKWPDGAEAFLNVPLMGHLERLAHYGKLSHSRRDGLMTFAWKG